MASFTPITTGTPRLRIEATEEDSAAERPEDLRRWAEQLLVIRRFEEKILDLHGRGHVHGPAHASIGQEAGAVAAMSVLGSGGESAPAVPRPLDAAAPGEAAKVARGLRRRVGREPIPADSLLFAQAAGGTPLRQGRMQ